MHGQIGTASRAETQSWVRSLGAHEVIDHAQPLVAQLATLGIAGVDHAASLTHSDAHYPALIDALVPQGRLALIDDPGLLDVIALKRNSLSLHWKRCSRARPQRRAILARIEDA